MKKILLATDLSHVSTNAAQFALAFLGKEMDENEAEFTLFHVIYNAADIAAFGGVPVSNDQKAFEGREALLKIQAENLKKAFPKLKIKAVMKTGYVVSTIVDYIKEEGFDLVVVGTHAKSGLERWIEGLNAYEIIKDAGCSGLAIPERSRYTKPKKIVFATDFRNLKDLSVLNPLKEMVDELDADLMMLHIYSRSKIMPQEMNHMNQIIEEYLDTDAYVPFFIEDDDPADEIEDFVEDKEANLLVLVAQERTFFESLFHKSVTKEMIIHAELPLLVLNDGKE